MCTATPLANNHGVFRGVASSCMFITRDVLVQHPSHGTLHFCPLGEAGAPQRGMWHACWRLAAAAGVVCAGVHKHGCDMRAWTQVNEYLKDRRQPIWASLSATRTELYRDIQAVYYGHSPFLCRQGGALKQSLLPPPCHPALLVIPSIPCRECNIIVLPHMSSGCSSCAPTYAQLHTCRCLVACSVGGDGAWLHAGSSTRRALSGAGSTSSGTTGGR